jgi:transcription antitermination factor NusG
MALKWYVIRTKPQSEYIAAASLEREGLETLFARVRSPWSRPGQADMPLFPGYLFTRCDPENDDCQPVYRLPGISGWVKFGGVAPPVPDEVVAMLSRRVEMINGGGGLWTRFRRGEKVRVVSGAMDGLAEVVDEPVSPQARVRVLLDFMGRQVPAQVPCRDLRPVSETFLANEKIRRLRRTRGRGRWIRGFGPRAAATV